MFSIHWEKALNVKLIETDAVKKMLAKKNSGKIGFLDAPYNKDGLKRAKEFTWEKCAQETMEVYKKTLKQPLVKIKDKQNKLIINS